METEKVRINCPYCNKGLFVIKEHAGKEAKCPECSRSFKIKSWQGLLASSQVIIEEEEILSSDKGKKGLGKSLVKNWTGY